MTACRHTTLADIAKHFDALEDPRCPINRRHPLTSVVVIAIMAILAGANGPTAIATWAQAKQAWLVQRLPLPFGVPCKDVFRIVLTLLNPAVFQACFAQWLKTLRLDALDDCHIERPDLWRRWQDASAQPRSWQRSQRAAFRQCVGQ